MKPGIQSLTRSLSPPLAAERLELEKERIIEVWSARVREALPAAREISAPALIDTLPGLLDEIAGALRTGKLEHETRISGLHGTQRSSTTSFSLEQVFEEYHLLGQVMIEILETEAPLNTEARDILLTVIRLATRHAARTFQSHRHATEESYRLLIDGIHDHAIIHLDLENRILEWNPGAQKLFQYGKEEALGRSGSMIFTQEDRASGEDVREMQTALAHGRAEDKRWHVRKDGSRLFVDGIMNLLRGEDGRAIGFIKVCKDFTEGRLAQIRLDQTTRDLRASEERYRQLFVSAPVGIAEVDPHTRVFLRVNPKYREMLGMTEEELVGRSVAEVTWPEDDDRDRAANIELLTGVQSRYQTEKRYVRRDGALIWADLSVTTVHDGNGKPLFNIAVAQDISERKSFEAALEESRLNLNLALSASKVGIWDMDLRTGAIHWSVEEAEIMGFPPNALDSNMDEFIERVHPDDRDRVQAAVREAIASGNDYHSEFRIRKGDKVAWLVGKAKVLYEGEEPVRMIGTNLDISERRFAQDELQRVVERLQEEKAVRERFVTTLTHDMRNPLTSAKVSAQLLLKYREESEKRERLTHRIVESLERAERMVGDLLDASRIQAGQKLPMRLEHFDLGQVVESAVEDLAVVHGSRFQIAVETGLEGWFSRDGMRRVVENLAENAIKYGAADSPITVSARKSGDRAQISVHNQGRALSDAERESLFDMFRRAKSAEASEQRGWGIGLTLVKGIAEAHGGTVRVESCPSAGTTFTIDVPLRPDAGGLAK